MFTLEQFRGLEKSNTAVARIPSCAGCKQAAIADYSWRLSLSKATELTDGMPLDLAYYWEWSGREKVFKPCFGLVHEALAYGNEMKLHKQALYKLVPIPGKRDYDRFERKLWGAQFGALPQHQHDAHFNLADLDAMLMNPAHVPAGTTGWAYWSAT